MTVFHHKTRFSQTSKLLFMFQCVNVEMNKFLCSLACTLMTIMDIFKCFIGMKRKLGGCLVVTYYDKELFYKDAKHI